ncbi:MAG: hypothetical protein IT292_07695 [Deltaproteobacteria bacterium]|nr:hypothetical protein [Deltaproteobacteria bacterium]
MIPLIYGNSEQNLQRRSNIRNKPALFAKRRERDLVSSWIKNASKLISSALNVSTDVQFSCKSTPDLVSSLKATKQPYQVLCKFLVNNLEFVLIFSGQYTREIISQCTGSQVIPVVTPLDNQELTIFSYLVTKCLSAYNQTASDTIYLALVRSIRVENDNIPKDCLSEELFSYQNSEFIFSDVTINIGQSICHCFVGLSSVFVKDIAVRARFQSLTTSESRLLTNLCYNFTVQIPVKMSSILQFAQIEAGSKLAWSTKNNGKQNITNVKINYENYEFSLRLAEQQSAKTAKDSFHEN